LVTSVAALRGVASSVSDNGGFSCSLFVCLDFRIGFFGTVFSAVCQPG
jgi:hypothetical protein